MCVPNTGSILTDYRHVSIKISADILAKQFKPKAIYISSYLKANQQRNLKKEMNIMTELKTTYIITESL